MSASVTTGSVKEREWTERLQRFERSGQTVARFCEAERISPPSFYLWRKRLGIASGRSRSVGPRSRGSGRRGPRRPSAFQPVFMIPPQAAPNATIRLPNGVVIELRDDPAAIVSVLGPLCERGLNWDRARSGDDPC